MRYGRSSRWRAALVAVALVLAIGLVLRAPEARASTVPGDTRVEGWTELFKYGGCAAGIAFAATTMQIWVAVFSCASLMSEELGG